SKSEEPFTSKYCDPPFELFRICQTPIEPRHTAKSALPSPSKSLSLALVPGGGVGMGVGVGVGTGVGVGIGVGVGMGVGVGFGAGVGVGEGLCVGVGVGVKPLATERLRVLSTVRNAASVRRIVKLNGPISAGVPMIVPPEVRNTPDGNAPPIRLQS